MTGDTMGEPKVLPDSHESHSMSVSSSLPKHGTRMSFEEFQALNLPEDTPYSLLGGVVFVEGEDGIGDEDGRLY